MLECVSRGVVAQQVKRNYILRLSQLFATQNWCSLNASLKRSHAIPDGLKLFRALSVMLIERYGLACAQHNSLQL